MDHVGYDQNSASANRRTVEALERRVTLLEHHVEALLALHPPERPQRAPRPKGTNDSSGAAQTPPSS